MDVHNLVSEEMHASVSEMKCQADLRLETKCYGRTKAAECPAMRRFYIRLCVNGRRKSGAFYSLSHQAR